MKATTYTSIKSMIVARTEEQESLSDDGVFWWKEFRLRQITAEEFDLIQPFDQYKPWLLEERYVFRTCPNGRIWGKLPDESYQSAIVNDRNPDSVWRPWQTGNSPKKVLWEMLGDSSFLEATSLCNLHRRLVQQLLELRSAEDDAFKAGKVLDDALESIQDFKTRVNREFSKRHGHKTGTDYDQAFARAKKRLQPEMDRLYLESRKAGESKDRADKHVEELRRKYGVS